MNQEISNDKTSYVLEQMALRDQKQALMQIRIPKKRNLMDREGVADSDGDMNMREDITEPSEQDSLGKRQRLTEKEEKDPEPEDYSAEQRQALRQSIENAKNVSNQMCTLIIYYSCQLQSIVTKF